MAEPRRAIVLLSGGIDSAVALFWARREGFAVQALEFEYHERPRRERECSIELARRAGATRVSVPVPFLREALDAEPPPHLKNAPRGYIPARNLVFYSIAGYYAEWFGATTIVGGHNRDDAARFPDASRGFLEALGRLYSQALWSCRGRALEIALPLVEKDKIETLRMGLELEVPFEHTWSCYEDRETSCGACPHCAERARAFAACGAQDPLL
jgi:7-cyano-7-deazaguanine synthase